MNLYNINVKLNDIGPRQSVIFSHGSPSLKEPAQTDLAAAHPFNVHTMYSF